MSGLIVPIAGSNNGGRNFNHEAGRREPVEDGRRDVDAPMLMNAYLFCLIVGGGLVFVSLISGLGETDADLDADADADVGGDVGADMDADLGADVGGADFDVAAGDFDVDDLPFDFDLDGADIDADADIDAESGSGGLTEYEVSRQKRFNPFVSLKFWTFTAAFFGLTGTLFEGLGLWSSPTGIFVLSLGIGLSMGTAMAYLIHIADQGAGKGLSERDYLGASADVRLPIRPDKAGKIRVRVRGRIIDMRAELADDEEALEMNDKCFVIGIEEETAQVISAAAVEQQLTDAGETETVLADGGDEDDEEFDEELERERQQQEHVTS